MTQDEAGSPFITITYQFRWPGGKEEEFNVLLDRESLTLVHQQERALPPNWARLETFRCPVCPLSQNHFPYCPTAVRLMELVSFFGDTISYEDVDVTVITPERNFSKQITVQQGLSSLMGIYMVAGGCPVMEKLKPMVRFHLPFASLTETRYRALSMYMMAQYFRHRQGKEADLDLKGFFELYEKIHQVNLHFSKRLRAMIQEDASMNALSILNTFADSVLFTMEEDSFSDLEPLFEAYLK